MYVNEKKTKNEFQKFYCFCSLLLLGLAGYGVIIGSNLQYHIQFNTV